MISWQIKTIRDLASLIKDGTHGTHKEHPAGIPLLSAKDIGNGKVTFNNSPRLISELEFNAIHKGYKLQDDDILLTIVGSLGRVAMIQDYRNNYTFQRSVAILRFNDSILPRYMYHALTDWRFQKELLKRESKGAQGGVYLGEIAKIKLNLPEKPEQRRIVAVLEVWDEYLELLDRKIALKEQLKKGLMQQLLTGKKRLPGFIDEWKEYRIGDLLTTLTDYTANGSFASLKENVRYFSTPEHSVLVRTTDLEKKVFSPQRFTDKRGYDYLKKTSLYGGELIMSNVGNIGKIYRVPKYQGLMTLAPNTYLIKFHEEIVDPNFIYQKMLTKHFRDTVLKMVGGGEGGGLVAINKANFKSIKLCVPRDVDEQTAVAKVFETMDNDIVLLGSRRDMVSMQKKYLLKNLISGTIRTPENLHIKGAN